MANPSNTDVADSNQAFQRILLAVDDSDATVRAAGYVRALFADHARVKLLSVAQNPLSLFPRGLKTQGFIAAARDELLGDAREALDRIAAMFSDGQVETEIADLSVINGDTVHALLDAASQWRPDLIVMGARHHQGLLRWLEGTVSEPLTRLASCSLLIVPENCRVATDRRPARVEFALDGSASSLVALQAGLQLAAPDTQLRAVYVVDRVVHLLDVAPVNMLESVFLEEGCLALDRAARIFADHGHYGETALIKTHRNQDDVPHAIMRDTLQWNADLLVVGTHGRRGLMRWFLGSVAARTIRIADTPVLLVRAKEDA